MAYAPGFKNDIFISYSHFDNQAVEGEVGWVEGFHRRLHIKIQEELGAHVRIWRDVRLGFAADFSVDIDSQLRASAMLLVVLSPGYRGSAWCEREAKAFIKERLRAGDLWIETPGGSRCRVMKIAKRTASVPLLPEVLSLDFFSADEASRRSYELEAGSTRFNRLLADAAAEIALILRAMRKARTAWCPLIRSVRSVGKHARTELDSHPHHRAEA